MRWVQGGMASPCCCGVWESLMSWAAAGTARMGWQHCALRPTQCPLHGPCSTLSYGKPASQSSDLASSTSASLAVDGNTNQVFFTGSCTHTSNDAAGPWWCVVGELLLLLMVLQHLPAAVAPAYAAAGPWGAGCAAAAATAGVCCFQWRTQQQRSLPWF